MLLPSEILPRRVTCLPRTVSLFLVRRRSDAPPASDEPQLSWAFTARRTMVFRDVDDSADRTLWSRAVPGDICLIGWSDYADAFCVEWHGTRAEFDARYAVVPESAYPPEAGPP